MYSKKLKDIRKKLGFSQEEMAFKTDTSYRAYSSYERGDRKPSFEFLQKLVEEFGVNLNWLIADNGIPFIEKARSVPLPLMRTLSHFSISAPRASMAFPIFA